MQLVDVNTGGLEFSSGFSAQSTEAFIANNRPNKQRVLQELLEKAFRDCLSKLEGNENEEDKVPQEDAYIEINSNPLGAQVYVDGIYRGETPLAITVKKGSVELELLYKGFESWRRKVQTFDGLKVNAVLE